MKNSGITPDSHDYHGNFNAELFERLFTRLCAILHADHGPCMIHMDGARYHMRKINQPPTASDNKAAILSWFNEHGLTVPKQSNGKPGTKTALLTFIKSLDMPIQHATYNIAQQYWHYVVKTPPYHCKVLPIEGLWGMIKNIIANKPNPRPTTSNMRN